LTFIKPLLFQKLGLQLPAVVWVQKHQSKQVTVEVASVLQPGWMATDQFALPCDAASPQPLLAGDCYESQGVARQKTEQKDFSRLTLPCLICCKRTFHLHSPFVTDVAFIVVACGKSLVNGSEYKRLQLGTWRLVQQAVFVWNQFNGLSSCREIT